VLGLITCSFEVALAHAYIAITTGPDTFLPRNALLRYVSIELKELLTYLLTYLLTVQSAVLLSHVVSPSVRPSVHLSLCDVGGS